jgi:hypothetical protein
MCRSRYCTGALDLVLHLAAESHVDRSIEGPGAYGSTSSPDCVTIASNVSGTFHLLQALRAHWQHLPAERQAASDHLVNAWHHTDGLPVVILTELGWCQRWSAGRVDAAHPRSPFLVWVRAMGSVAQRPQAAYAGKTF